MRAWSWRLPATTLAVGMALAGCSHATGTKVTVQPSLATAISRSQTQQTFRFTLIESERSSKVTLQGMVDEQTQSLEMTGTVPAAPDDSNQFREIQIGRTTWIQEPPYLTSPNQWLSVTTGGNGSGAPRLPFGDPTKIFVFMKDHLSNLRLLGTAVIGGITTDHYEGSVTSPLSGPNPSSTPSTGPPAVVTEVAEVWIDSSGLVRQFRDAISFNAPSGLGSDTTIDFSDYGQPVDIQAPPPGQVITSQQAVASIPTVTVAPAHS